MTARAASGARLLGDDVQHLITWYHVLRSQRADAAIVEFAVEAAGAGNVDDVTLLMSEGPDEYWQIKASVDATSPVTAEWLLAQPGGKPSLLQRLHTSWIMLRPRHAVPPKIVLATTKAIENSDIVLGPRATTDCRIVETFRDAKGPVALVRQEWAAHLGIDEDELIEFLECLQIRHGQSEAEWEEKVNDAAVGARVRTGTEAVALGLRQVRDWIKAPRRTFNREQLTSLIDTLRLRVPAARALLVIESLEEDPRSAKAAYAIDWTGLIEGDSPDNRRTFTDPASARTRVLTDLADARRRFRDLEVTDIEVEGTMRLPLWFTVGTAFSSTAGFTVAAQARSGLWTSTAEPGNRQDLALHLPEADDLHSRPWAVSVSLACDIAPDVETYIKRSHPEARHIKTQLPTPGRSAIEGLAHARTLIYELREKLRDLTQIHDPQEILLFLAMPHACALLLGNSWDRMPPTTVFWDLGRPGSYEPALRVN